MVQRSIWAAILLAGMILGSYRGQLALWTDPDQEPVQIFPRLVSMLPDADRQRLEDGISIRDESKLHRLLQDYLS